MPLFKRSNKDGQIAIDYDPSKVYSPIPGVIKPIEDLKDGMFSEKMLGDGVYIVPSPGTKKLDVLAPVSGKIVAMVPGGHAYGIETKQGVEVLVHLGIDTVNLKGKGFEPVVQKDMNVKAGDKLASYDVEFIRSKNYIAEAIVVLSKQGTDIADVEYGPTAAGSTLFTITPESFSINN